MNVSVSPDSSTSVDPSVSVMVNPAMSLSAVVTVKDWSSNGSKLSSELRSTTEMVTVEFCVPSARSSSAPVTITVCGESQFADVKVSDPGETVDSSVSSDEMAMTTSEIGSEFSTTVKLSVSPSSFTPVDPPDSITVNPAVSLSVVVTETAWSATLSKSSSEFPSTIESVTAVIWLSSSTQSLIPVAVTVCGVFQLAAVKVSVAGLTVTSPVSAEVTEIWTSLVGWASRTTLNVSVVLDSFTSVPDSVSVMVNPATSSSVVEAVTVWSVTLSKSSSDIASTIVTVIVEFIVPSIMSSSTPVTVTVCAVSQFSDVKVTVPVTVDSPASDEVMERTTLLSG